MTKRFPRYTNHAEVVCFKCEGPVAAAFPTDNAPGRGQWVAECPRCRMSTWYDIKKKRAA